MLVSTAGLYGIWGAALALTTGVALGLAVLLVMLLRTSRAIEGHTARSLLAVQRIAQDTDALSALADTHRVALNILAVSQAIERRDQEIADALTG